MEMIGLIAQRFIRLRSEMDTDGEMYGIGSRQIKHQGQRFATEGWRPELGAAASTA